LIQGNFSVYIMAFNDISMVDSQISGPRIGLCTTDISVYGSTISTDRKGCLSETGLGAGVIFNGCAASGAAHGGDGGPGAQL